MTELQNTTSNLLLDVEGRIQTIDGPLNITLKLTKPQRQSEDRPIWYCCVTIPQIDLIDARFYSTDEKGAIDAGLTALCENLRLELLGEEDAIVNDQD